MSSNMLPEEDTIERAPHDREHPFIMVSREIARNKSISIAAKGLMLYFLSLPNDWKINKNNICNEVGCGKDKLNALLKELIDEGYAKEETLKGSCGRFGPSKVIVCEFKRFLPERKILHGENLFNPTEKSPEDSKKDNQSGFTAAVNPPLLNKENTNIDDDREKKFLDNGVERVMNVTDVHSYAVKFKPDWKYDEIQHAWRKFLQYQDTVEHPFEYIEGIINNERIILQNKERKCKKTIVTTQIKREPSKNVNVFYSEKDTHLSPLAAFARQNGYK